jgi:hypothetical protein
MSAESAARTDHGSTFRPSSLSSPSCMNKLLESAGIALDASGRRLGRSRPCSQHRGGDSIIAVVSLIQGLNASVTSAILNQAGADSFNIQQFPVTRSDEEFDKVRANPRITISDARAIKRYDPEEIAAVMAESGGSARVTYRDRSIDSTRVQGVTSDYVNFSTFDAERGRLTDERTFRPVAVLLRRPIDCRFINRLIDKTIQISGIPPRRGASKKRFALGQSQTSSS